MQALEAGVIAVVVIAAMLLLYHFYSDGALNAYIPTKWDPVAAAAVPAAVPANKSGFSVRSTIGQVALPAFASPGNKPDSRSSFILPGGASWQGMADGTDFLDRSMFA